MTLRSPSRAPFVFSWVHDRLFAVPIGGFFVATKKKGRVMQKLRILAITGHDDDLTLHCGGLIIELLERGHEITPIIMTLGQRGQRFPQFGNGLAWEVRKAETRAAYATMGMTPNFVHTRYEQECDIDARSRDEMKRLVADLEPHMFLAHWPVDVNPDHRAGAVLAMEPAFQRNVNTELIFFKPHSAGRETAMTRPQVTCFIPTHYLPLREEVIEIKRRSVIHHVSQDPEAMLIGQQKVQEEDAEELRAHFPNFLPGVTEVEAYIRGNRAGALLPELADILYPTPYLLPRSVVRHDPKVYGVDAPSTL